MTDLHCHILPQIDDGAKDIQTSLKLLEMEKKDGINNVALTSHFYCEYTVLEKFLSDRNLAFEKLKGNLGELKDCFSFKLGCEVFFSPRLFHMEIQKLCLEDTKVLLLELPTTHCPQFFNEFLLDVQEKGIIPVIAHVERYLYVINNPDILFHWIEAGAFMQINANALFKNKNQTNRIVKFIKWGLVHVIASDAHSLEKRPPKMQQAFSILEKALGSKTVNLLQQNADMLFEGRELELCEIHRPKKFGRWWY